MLGHSSAAFTLDAYSHFVGGLQKAAMKRLGEMLLLEPFQNRDVGKMLAEGTGTGTASGQSRTDDRRFTKLSDSVPNGYLAFKLGLLYQRSKSHFVREVPISYFVF
jgi:hypothetical protein